MNRLGQDLNNVNALLKGLSQLKICMDDDASGAQQVK